VLDEIFVERISKENVEHEVMLASIVTVETNVIINAIFVQHVKKRDLVRVGQTLSRVFYFEKIRRLIMIEAAHFLIQELSIVCLG